MKLELTFFIGILLAFFVLIILCIDFLRERSIINAVKKIRRERKTCEVCASVYFFSVTAKYWRCPLCGSMNKEQ